MIFPDFQTFKKKAKQGNLIPVYGEVSADLDTPVSAYLKVCQPHPYSFLLESVEGGERTARYSFLGCNPFRIFESKGKTFKIFDSKGKVYKQGETTDPLLELQNLLSSFRPVHDKNLPRFSGGAVGFFAYDMVRHFEKLPDDRPDDLRLPDCVFMITDSLLIFDHLKHTIKVLSNALVESSAPLAYKKAQLKVMRKVHLLSGLEKIKQAERARLTEHKPSALKSNFTKKQYYEAVLKAKEYIRAGDIIQVVPSQRFERAVNSSPLSIYRALRSVNPSPYLYFLKFPSLQIIGSSPEMLVRVEGKEVDTRPIAGTRRRGVNEQEDRELADELMKDEKERAEHLMLVDLGRNDLGRVCDPGSVKLTEFMAVEKYSHVMHLVSNVHGALKHGKTAFDVIRACFPAGTVSGAPKIRAMEIIEELEPAKRGIYAGAVGYFDFSGNMDTAIAIRTIVLKGKTAYVQAGGGIVADSVPKKEYQETVNKAKALLKAIEIAETL